VRSEATAIATSPAEILIIWPSSKRQIDVKKLSLFLRYAPSAVLHPAGVGAGHGLSGILGATGAERCGTGHDEAIYDATNQHNARGNSQVCIEVAESDCFPSDEGAE